MIYEELAEKHIEALAALYVKSYNAPPWNDGWSLETARRHLLEILDSGGAFGLVAVDDSGAPVGAIMGEGETYYNARQFFIKDFFVAGHLQKTGIGSALMAELEGYLRENGFTKTYLFTSRTDDTEGYYLRRGYKSWNGMVLMGKTLKTEE